MLATIVALSAVSLSATSVLAQDSSLESSLAGGFASITTVQEGDTITITITKGTEGGEAAPPTEGNETIPTDPIVIVPDPGGNGSGEIIVPGENVTAPPSEGNETTTPPVEEPPVIIVPPNGSVIEVPPPSNVTEVGGDNDTVIIAPPGDNVTEVEPPDGPIIIVPEPEPCGCPPAAEVPPSNETGGLAPNQDLPEPPASSDNTTVIVEAPPAPAQLPVFPPEDGSSGDGNGDGDGSSDGN